MGHERVRRHPERFVLAGEGPGDAAARIDRIHARRLGGEG